MLPLGQVRGDEELQSPPPPPPVLFPLREVMLVKIPSPFSYGRWCLPVQGSPPTPPSPWVGWGGGGDWFLVTFQSWAASTTNCAPGGPFRSWAATSARPSPVQKRGSFSSSQDSMHFRYLMHFDLARTWNSNHLVKTGWINLRAWQLRASVLILYQQFSPKPEGMPLAHRWKIIDKPQNIKPCKAEIPLGLASSHAI